MLSGTLRTALDGQSSGDGPQPTADTFGIAERTERGRRLQGNILPDFFDVILVGKLPADCRFDRTLKATVEFCEALVISHLSGDDEACDRRFFFRFFDCGNQDFFLRRGLVSG